MFLQNSVSRLINSKIVKYAYLPNKQMTIGAPQLSMA